MKKFGYILGFIVISMVICLFVIGTLSPETSIYHGRKLPKRFLKEINSLGLLEKNEDIVYFYSDGFLDIKEGMYFVTDRKLVVYCQDCSTPKTIIPYSNITKLDIVYDDSFLDDSYIFVEAKEGVAIDFPISSEKGKDKLFYSYLQNAIK